MKFPFGFALTVVLALAAVLAQPHAMRAAPKAATVTPRHDPPDMPFRAAPTPAATRSVAIAVSTNLHVGFDTDRCRVHTVWRGRGLNLFGPQYSLAKSPFISTFDGEVLWTMPPLFPWAIGKIPAEELPTMPATGKFLGLRTKLGRTLFDFKIGDLPENSAIEESHHAEQFDGVAALARRFAIHGRRTEPLFYLAHAEVGEASHVAGRTDAVVIERPTDVLLVAARGAVKWHINSRDVHYTVERISEIGAEKGNVRAAVTRRETRLWLEISANDGGLVEVVTAVCATPAQARAMLHSGFDAAIPAVIAATTGTNQLAAVHPVAPRVFAPSATARPSVAGNEFFRVENFPVPKETELLITGMDFFTNGNLAVATWLGEVFIVEGATGPVNQARYRRVARGLLEPMGLLNTANGIAVAQKSEVTMLSGPDADGNMETFSAASRDWDYSGHYNAFVYGPTADKEGNLVIAIAGHASRWELKHMGWALRIPASAGEPATPIASGLREPNGLGTFGPDRDIFVTDNQGNWIAACKLNHLQPGKFYGHPSSKPAPENEYGKTTKFDPPAVWFPYKLVRSASGFVEIPDDRFGPFKGQLLVGDFQNALVTRVFLEKVNGEYQGAVWPLLKGFLSGVNRLAFGPDGNLYVGGCQRTWAAVAPLEAALERVSFTGKVPFEVREARAQRDGFELTFTQAVEPASAGNAESYDVTQYTYRYTAKYGSPELDHEGRENRATGITVTKAEVSADRLKVRLYLQGWKTGYVTTVRGTDVKNTAGEALVNPTFYYTLNQVPK